MTKHSLVSFRLTRHLALGLGAVGLALGASGASVAATALVQPAGALSVQVPAVAVREQNVNAAGRIRVALPKTSVGVNGSVSVSNLPLNSAGRLQTQNGTGNSHSAQAWNVIAGSGAYGLTPVNVSGSGVFKGLTLTAYQDGNAGCAAAAVTIDGQSLFSEAIGGASEFGTTSPIEGGANPNNGGNNYLYFNPPGGLPFHKSLSVSVFSNCGGQHMPVAYRIWYTTNN